MALTTADALLQPVLARLPVGSRGGTYRFDLGDCAHVTLPDGQYIKSDGDSPDAAIKHLERRLEAMGLLDPWNDPFGA